MFYFICVWINGWVNNREAGDLRRHLAHYDVTVMDIPDPTPCCPNNAIWRRIICVNIGSVNGLLVDGTKSLAEPMLTSLVWFCGNPMRAVSQPVLKLLLYITILKIMLYKLLPYLPGQMSSLIFMILKWYSCVLYKKKSCWNQWGQVTHICVSILGHHWFRLGLVDCSVPGHQLKRCWLIVNCVQFSATLKPNTHFHTRNDFVWKKWRPFVSASIC